MAPAADHDPALPRRRTDGASPADGVQALAGDALLAGTTGLIGSALAAQWPGPGTLHCLVRRPWRASGPRTRILEVDYRHLPPLPPARQAYCCLGSTIKAAGSQQAFRAVDLDAVVAFARAAQAAGVRRLAVVSALGASPGSANFYSRVKGEMEAALAALDFETLVVARPSLLVGDRSALGQPSRPLEQLAQWLSAPLASVLPRVWRPIPAAAVARALLRTLPTAPPGVTRLTSAVLHRRGADEPA